MARASLTVQNVPYSGKTSASLTFTAPSGAGANNGWSFSNTGDQILVVKNSDESTKTLTLDVIGTLGGITPADTTITVPAAAAGVLGYAYATFPKEPPNALRRKEHPDRERACASRTGRGVRIHNQPGRHAA
jgi:hypothetical protein